MYHELNDVSEALRGLDYRQIRPLRSGVYGLLMLTVRDRDGRVVERRIQRTRSPINWFFLWLTVSYTNSNFNLTYINASVPATTSTSTVTVNQQSIGITHYNNIIGAYIVVGSGTLSNPYSASTLAAPIGTSIVNYGNPSLSSSVTTSGSEAYFVMTETITNNSSSTITISEIGIFMGLNYIDTTSGYISGGPFWILVWYDALSSPISVGSGQSLTITYTFTANP